jgi:hypothetical protein
METGARARGHGWLGARACAWRWCLRALGRGSHGAGRSRANDGTQRERGPATCARCAILIGSTAIRNPRIPLKPRAMFF